MVLKVNVSLDKNSYEIMIFNNFQNNILKLLGPHIKQKKIAVITDKNVERLHLTSFSRF